MRRSDHDERIGTPFVPWLDTATVRYLRALIAHIAEDVPTAFAVILFGSVARHEERPLSDAYPSDVDVLVLFTPAHGTGDSEVRVTLTVQQHRELSWAIVRAFAASPDAPRDVQVLGALASFAHWDSTLVEHVATDGILLWSRGPLPPYCSAIHMAIARRTFAFPDRTPPLLSSCIRMYG